MIEMVVSNAVATDETVMANYKVVARFNLAIGGAAFLNNCVLVTRPKTGWTILGPGRDVKFTAKARRQIKRAVLRNLGMDVPSQLED